MVKKNYHVIWSYYAILGLKDLIEYIAQDSSQAAKRVKQEIKKLASSLKTSPYKFEADRFTNNQAYRAVAIWDYKIVYKVTSDKIYIIDVYHTSREPKEYKDK